MGLFSRIKAKQEDARKAELEAIKMEMLKDVQVERDKIFQEAQQKLMEDPVFANAWRVKQANDVQMAELNQVLDLGLTERVIRKLIQGSEERQVTVTIRFPRVADKNGNMIGGEEVFIQPIDKYEQMRKQLTGETEQLW